MKLAKHSTILLTLTVLTLMALAATGSYASDRIGAGASWTYDVVQSRLPRVDNVVIGPDKAIYVTLERSHGNGEIIRLRNGGVQTIASGLNRPDGLVASGSNLYLSEEVYGGRILKISLKDLRISEIARLKGPEGIKVNQDGVLIIAQDLTDGRVISLSNGVVTVLAEHLLRPEGLSLGAHGEIYVAETATGRILRISKAGIETLIEGLNEPDQVATGPDGSLWITEDRKVARLLRFKSGRLETVLSKLSEPQGIAVIDADSVYVSEQGRDRLLYVHRAD